jgi:thioredoxin-like negative regulator of GroEL
MIRNTSASAPRWGDRRNPVAGDEIEELVALAAREDEAIVTLVHAVRLLEQVRAAQALLQQLPPTDLRAALERRGRVLRLVASA